jgi:hypothetical protein
VPTTAGHGLPGQRAAPMRFLSPNQATPLYSLAKGSPRRSIFRQRAVPLVELADNACPLSRRRPKTEGSDRPRPYTLRTQFTMP